MNKVSYKEREYNVTNLLPKLRRRTHTHTLYLHNLPQCLKRAVVCQQGIPSEMQGEDVVVLLYY